MANFGEQSNFPLNFVGPRGQNAFLGAAELNIMGSGMVRDVVGVPGFKATLVSTGTYDLSFDRGTQKFLPSNAPSGTYPMVQNLQIWPALRGGSGAQHLEAKIVSRNSGSGTAQLRITNLLVGASGAAGVPSGFAMQANAPSGTAVDLLIGSWPITPY